LKKVDVAFKVDRNETTFIALIGTGYDNRKTDSNTINKDEIPDKQVCILPNQVLSFNNLV
jgi:hypothetical protein